VARTISRCREDGHTLTPVEEGRELGANTAFAKLITSLVEAGFPETNLPEDEINFESIIGTRVRFVQRTDVEGTKKLGKRKDKKTGKEYDRQDLVIEQVYSLPGAAAPTAAKAPKGKAAPAAKGGKKVAAEATNDAVAEFAAETVRNIVMEAGGSISKAKLGMAVFKAVVKHDDREPIRKLVASADFLNGIEGLAFDGTTVSVAA
jgi:hypothetical protein